jgi:peptidoglycan hydrolase CwlO-like protein
MYFENVLIPNIEDLNDLEEFKNQINEQKNELDRVLANAEAKREELEQQKSGTDSDELEPKSDGKPGAGATQKKIQGDG